MLLQFIAPSTHTQKKRENRGFGYCYFLMFCARDVTSTCWVNNIHCRSLRCKTKVSKSHRYVGYIQEIGDPFCASRRSLILTSLLSLVVVTDVNTEFLSSFPRNCPVKQDQVGGESSGEGQPIRREVQRVWGFNSRNISILHQSLLTTQIQA